jgi:hypothetical protein
MALNFWAIVVAATGWFSIGKLIAGRGKINKTGKIPTPARYLTRRGAVAEMEWKITERQPAGFGLLLLLAVLSTAPLLAPKVPWNWLAIIILSILSLVTLVFFGVILNSDVLYFREIERQDKADGTASITYKLEDVPFPKKRGALIVLALTFFWIPVYWLAGKFGFDDWVLTGILLVGFAIMVCLMYLGKKAERKWYISSFDYCERCGERTKSETRPVVSREHAGGNNYIERTEMKVIQKCRLCGYEKSY